MLSVFSCFLFLALIGAALANYGEYVPKSYYIIDHTGHKSDVVYIRNRRDLIPILRQRRSGGGGSSASSSAHATASASSSANAGSGAGYNPNFVFPDIANFDPFSGEGSAFNAIRSLAGVGSSGHSVQSGQQHHYQGGSGGLGAGQDAGYNGPILFSRFGETEGQGVVASGAAQGPNAAFSSVKTSSENGKVQYSVKSGKY